jgi:hypothetical protein
LLAGLNTDVGPHTLRFVIDPENAIDEDNEDDNVYELTVEWLASAPAAPEPTTYTDEELTALFDGFTALLDDPRPVLGADPSAAGVERTVDIADAAYFLATGESMRDSPVTITLVDDEAYRAKVDELFRDNFAQSPLHLYDSILGRREEFKFDVIGYTSFEQNHIAIVVNAERPFAGVITTLAHEFGHARQRLENPGQDSVAGSHALRGLKEAQAELFKRVAWLAIQSYLDIDLFSYPLSPAYEDFVADRIASDRARAASSQHALGRQLVWAMLYNDLGVAHLKTALVDNGKLNQAETLELYEFFVAKKVDFITLYVDARIEEFDSRQLLAAVNAINRLKADFDPSTEGPAALRQPALMMP